VRTALAHTGSGNERRVGRGQLRLEPPHLPTDSRTHTKDVTVWILARALDAQLESDRLER